MEIKAYPKRGKQPICSECNEKFDWFNGEERREMFKRLTIARRTITLCNPCMRSLREEIDNYLY